MHALRVSIVYLLHSLSLYLEALLKKYRNTAQNAPIIEHDPPASTGDGGARFESYLTLQTGNQPSSCPYLNPPTHPLLYIGPSSPVPLMLGAVADSHNASHRQQGTSTLPPRSRHARHHGQAKKRSPTNFPCGFSLPQQQHRPSAASSSKE